MEMGGGDGKAFKGDEMMVKADGVALRGNGA